jgi:hypothetical protein
MGKHDAARIVGIGTVTKWNPADLQRKLEIMDELQAHGFEGLALEQAALAKAGEHGVRPYGVARSHNTLVNGGTNIMLNALTSASIPVYYTNALAALGVGDSATAFNATQTNLQGAVVTTDRIRKAMNATFPSVATNVATFQSTFATGEANFVWNEWAIFNNVTDASGTMLNRSVANLGTKTSASAWQLTVTLTQS